MVSNSKPLSGDTSATRLPDDDKLRDFVEVGEHDDGLENLAYIRHLLHGPFRVLLRERDGMPSVRASSLGRASRFSCDVEPRK